MSGNRQRHEEAMSRGAQFAWDSDWRQAIEQFEIARSEFPDDPVPYIRIGQAYLESVEYDEALRFYQQAARLDPRNVVTLGRVADVLERSGQLGDAARVYLAVAEVHLKERSLDPAIANWERATRLDPNLLSARQRLALIYQRMGYTRDSIREHLALARIYQLRGDIQQAAAVCKSALEMDPGNLDILAAVALLRQGVMMEEVPDEPPPSGPPSLAPSPSLGASVTDAVRTAAQAFESSQVLGWEEEAEPEDEGGGSPVEEARQAALANLAGIVFEEDSAGADAMLSKADRDALISKAIELQTRGEIDEAIRILRTVLSSL